MSLRPFLSLCAAALLLASSSVDAQQALPLGLFVTHLQTPVSARLPPEQHEGAMVGTRRAFIELVEKLQKQYGRKSSAWPPEARKEYQDAEDARTLAEARRDYEAPQTRQLLTDSVADILRELSRNKVIQPVASADEAALIVQVTGRRLVPGADPINNGYFIRFRLMPGTKLAGDRFVELARSFDSWNTYFSKVLARPQDAAGYVDVEVHSPVSWRNCAGSVTAIVGAFVRERLDPAKKK